MSPEYKKQSRKGDHHTLSRNYHAVCGGDYEDPEDILDIFKNRNNRNNKTNRMKLFHNNNNNKMKLFFNL